MGKITESLRRAVHAREQKRKPHLGISDPRRFKREHQNKGKSKSRFRVLLRSNSIFRRADGTESIITPSTRNPLLESDRQKIQDLKASGCKFNTLRYAILSFETGNNFAPKYGQKIQQPKNYVNNGFKAANSACQDRFIAIMNSKPSPKQNFLPSISGRMVARAFISAPASGARRITRFMCRESLGSVDGIYPMQASTLNRAFVKQAGGLGGHGTNSAVSINHPSIMCNDIFIGYLANLY